VFGAKGAAHFRIVYRNASAIQAQELSQCVSRPEDRLRRHPGRKHPGGRVEIEHTGTRLERAGRESLVNDAQADDTMRALKSGPNIPPGCFLYESGVATNLAIDERRTRLKGCF